MEGWIPSKKIGNIAYCPRNWDAIFEATPDARLNIDPSHMVWQGIDYERAVRDYGDYIVHAHAKDVRLLDNYSTGTFGEDMPQQGWGAGLYMHAVPGQGDVAWGRFTDVLRESDYEGVLSVELEDPRYKPRKDVEQSKLGFIVARQNLLPYCEAA
jgi:sugar phosphate isomerase/epimerase